MSKKWLSILLVIMLAFTLTACGDNEAAKNSSLDAVKKRGKLVAGVRYDVNLFGFKDPSDGKVKGFEIDMMKELAKRLLGSEKKLELKEVTSKTRIPLLENGDVDIVASTMTITEERKQQLNFSHVYFMAGQSLLVKKSSNIKGIKDLRGKVVMTAKGATSGLVLKKLDPSIKLKEYENYADSFTALKSGKGDAVTTDDSILMGMQSQAPKEFKIVGGYFTQEPYGLGLAKGNKEMTTYVNKFLKDIKKDGTYKKLYIKWFKKSPPKDIPEEAVQKVLKK
ncbi:amino acid ABC transporter substrate-binding protein, PAAT family [Marininema mesophilum]|uniref:Amino acid ABC transporter substrate-binding protein, PAAT family n=1 Tax=Marininema mesophilum TaxID=1048340 RepID=A0A1H3CG86_9BACL|nr:transporter substrate-binding domain-containing protein [Marininema mesophilum]SDX53212.1 amino acid ABC transporter substrate-binding protein, PAAT family [Marininema mesophilum]